MKNIDLLISSILADKHNVLVKDNYKMKSLKWYQKIKINIYSWFVTIIYLPTILKAVLKNGK